MLRKLTFITVFVAILAAGDDDGGGGTVPPYTVWLPTVKMPSIEELYPECPHETTLISPEDGAIGGNIHGAVFTWRT